MTLFRDTRGGVPVLFIGLVFVMLLFTMLIMELGAVYNNYYEAETIVHRTINNVVEDAMLDGYRADMESKIIPPQVLHLINDALAHELPDKYQWRTVNVRFGTDPQGIMVVGEVTFDTIFSKYGFPDVTFPMRVGAYNKRLED